MIVVVYLLADAIDGIIHVRLFADREEVIDFMVGLPQCAACWVPGMHNPKTTSVRDSVAGAVRYLAKLMKAPTHASENYFAASGIAVSVEREIELRGPGELTYQVRFGSLNVFTHWAQV